jgi:hypothetical protein
MSTETCPFCGAEPRTDWGFKCGSGPLAGQRSIRCRESEVARLTKERDELNKRHDNLISDWAEIDQKIREFAIRAQVPKDVIDGDSYHVPGPLDVLALIGMQYGAAIARIKRLEEAGDAMAYNGNVDFDVLVAFWEKAKEAKP